jgi:hypothetical protein
MWACQERVPGFLASLRPRTLRESFERRVWFLCAIPSRDHRCRLVAELQKPTSAALRAAGFWRHRDTAVECFIRHAPNECVVIYPRPGSKIAGLAAVEKGKVDPLYALAPV